jgi:hypothetical protein
MFDFLPCYAMVYVYNSLILLKTSVVVGWTCKISFLLSSVKDNLTINYMLCRKLS